MLRILRKNRYDASGIHQKHPSQRARAPFLTIVDDMTVLRYSFFRQQPDSLALRISFKVSLNCFQVSD